LTALNLPLALDLLVPDLALLADLTTALDLTVLADLRPDLTVSSRPADLLLALDPAILADLRCVHHRAAGDRAGGRRRDPGTLHAGPEDLDPILCDASSTVPLR
jgi:hypothetical protein